jgi:hypothetical protein
MKVWCASVDDRAGDRSPPFRLISGATLHKTPIGTSKLISSSRAEGRETARKNVWGLDPNLKPSNEAPPSKPFNPALAPETEVELRLAAQVRWVRSTLHSLAALRTPKWQLSRASSIPTLTAWYLTGRELA